MKINIALTENKFITGYTNILLQNLPNESQSIVNNSCNEILAMNIIDYVDDDNVIQLLGLLVSKLRLGGKFSISGINLDIVVRNLLNKTLSEKDFNQMIKNIRSIRSRKSIVDILKAANLKVDIAITKGNIYEITSTRQ
jgi:hypothetical protein